MHGSIPEFDEHELDLARTRVRQRYGKEVELERVEVEVRLDPGIEALTWCPALYWTERDASFVILKTGARRYRPMFYYQPGEEYGTGRETYDDLDECVTVTLRVQADHEKERACAGSGKTADDFK